jgi:hypothetical protein
MLWRLNSRATGRFSQLLANSNPGISGHLTAPRHKGCHGLSVDPFSYWRRATDRIDANRRVFSGKAAAKDSLGRSPRNLAPKATRTEGACSMLELVPNIPFVVGHPVTLEK